MSTGDSQDVFTRIRGRLPPWFGDSTPILDAVLQGLAAALSFVYSLYAFAALQCRILSATEGYLDLIAADFFGTALPRKQGQSDASYRVAIIAALLRERATRNAIIRVLEDITGQTPRVFEPRRPADTGGYRIGGVGYSVAGGYGSLLMPYQAFVTAYRPAGTGIPNVAGYGISTGGYHIASQAEYASMSMIQQGVTDADIYAAIDSVKPAGTILWTRIEGAPLEFDLLDEDFILDESTLV